MSSRNAFRYPITEKLDKNLRRLSLSQRLLRFLPAKSAGTWQVTL
jgi:hypothetical protein